MMKFLMIGWLGLLLSLPTYAQIQDSLRRTTFSVALVPQYLVQQAIRVDLEMPLVRGKQMHRLTVSPYLYSGRTRRYEYAGVPTVVQQPDDYGETRVSGFGLEVLDKYTVRLINRRPSKLYLAYGLSYHRIGLDYTAYEPVPFTEAGVSLFRFGFADQQERVHRLDVIGLLGVKGFFYNSPLFFDLFAGPVLKNSWLNSDSGVVRDHDAPFDHGFNGVTYRVGAALGVLIF
ncbi:MAG: hypothetical protein WA960_13400 [Tunicatimonas sp.]